MCWIYLLAFLEIFKDKGWCEEINNLVAIAKFDVLYL